MKCCCNKENPQSCVCRKVMPIVLVAFLALAGYGLYVFMNKPDDRTAVERLGDAVKQLPNGLDAATQQLEDKTPTQKLEEGIKGMMP